MWNQGGSHLRVHPEGGSYIHPGKASLTPRGRNTGRCGTGRCPISEFTQREAPTYIQVRLHSHLRGVLAGVEQGGPRLRVHPERGSYIHPGEAPLTPSGALAGMEQGGAHLRVHPEGDSYIHPGKAPLTPRGVLAGVEQEVTISEFTQREAPTYIQVRLHSPPGEYWQVWNRECPSQSSPRGRLLHTSS